MCGIAVFWMGHLAWSSAPSDLQPDAVQDVGDGRFSVAPPSSNNSLNGIFAQGVITQTYTQASQLSVVEVQLSLLGPELVSTLCL